MAAVFGLEAYTGLLRSLVDSPRPLIGYGDAATAGCLLRLDVDYDLDWAVITARINRDLGVAATYFVQVGSELYSPATLSGRRALAELAASGQRIGLHYHHVGGAPLDIGRLEQEYGWLSQLCPGVERVVSWHNPEGDLAPLNTRAEAAGFVSAYAPGVFGPDRYVSDSNLRNTPQQIAKFVSSSAASRVQVLLHPCNWVAGGDDMGLVLQRILRHKTDRLLDSFDGNRVWRESTGARVKQGIRRAAWYRGCDGR
jgi:hypothetical protein